MGHQKQRPTPHPLKAHLWQTPQTPQVATSVLKSGLGRARIDNTAAERAAGEALDAHYEKQAARAGAQNKEQLGREADGKHKFASSQPSPNTSLPSSFPITPAPTMAPQSSVKADKPKPVTTTAKASTGRKPNALKAAPKKVTKGQRSSARLNPPLQTTSARLKKMPLIAQLATQEAETQSSTLKPSSQTSTMAPPTTTTPEPTPTPAATPVPVSAPTSTAADTTAPADETAITSTVNTSTVNTSTTATATPSSGTADILTTLPAYRVRALAHWPRKLMLPPWLCHRIGRNAAESERRKVRRALKKHVPKRTKHLLPWFFYNNGDYWAEATKWVREMRVHLGHPAVDTRARDVIERNEQEDVMEVDKAEKGGEDGGDGDEDVQG